MRSVLLAAGLIRGLATKEGWIYREFMGVSKDGEDVNSSQLDSPSFDVSSHVSEVSRAAPHHSV